MSTQDNLKQILRDAGFSGGITKMQYVQLLASTGLSSGQIQQLEEQFWIDNGATGSSYPQIKLSYYQDVLGCTANSITGCEAEIAENDINPWAVSGPVGGTFFDAAASLSPLLMYTCGDISLPLVDGGSVGIDIDTQNGAGVYDFGQTVSDELGDGVEVSSAASGGELDVSSISLALPATGYTMEVVSKIPTSNSSGDIFALWGGASDSWIRLQAVSSASDWRLLYRLNGVSFNPGQSATASNGTYRLQHCVINPSQQTKFYENGTFTRQSSGSVGADVSFTADRIAIAPSDSVGFGVAAAIIYPSVLTDEQITARAADSGLV